LNYNGVGKIVEEICTRIDGCRIIDNVCVDCIRDYVFGKAGAVGERRTHRPIRDKYTRPSLETLTTHFL